MRTVSKLDISEYDFCAVTTENFVYKSCYFCLFSIETASVAAVGSCFHHHLLIF